MADSSSPLPQPHPPEQRRSRVAGGLLKVGAPLAALLALLANGAQILPYFGINPPGPGPAPGITPAVTSTTPTPVPRPSPAGPTTAITGCFAAGAPVACSDPHDAESISGIPCTLDALVAYAGGLQGVDVLNTHVAIAAAQRGCKVTVPAGTRTPLKDALRAGGDDFRSCLDQGREVTCGVHHAGEIVYVGLSATESPDCTTRASAFLGAPFAQYNDKLTLGPGKAGELPMCFVTLRDPSRLLTSTLRGVRNRSFP